MKSCFMEVCCLVNYEKKPTIRTPLLREKGGRFHPQSPRQLARECILVEELHKLCYVPGQYVRVPCQQTHIEETCATCKSRVSQTGYDIVTFEITTCTE